MLQFHDQESKQTMKIPLHLKIRRNFNSLFNSLLAKIFPPKAQTELLDIKNIKTIALIRPNYRIGNIIFLTPLINEIHEQNPDIKIDLFIGSQSVGKVVQPMPNVDQIIDISRKLLINPIKLFHFIKNARAKKYDLCINISSRSLSSQIVTLFINSKYTLSFEDEKSWVPITHKVPHRWLFSHASLQPLEILDGFGISNYKHPLELDIKLTQEEIKTGEQTLQTLLQNNNVTDTQKIIAIFRNARFDKKIEDIWWEHLIAQMKQLKSNITVIDILSPDIPTKLNDDVIEYSNKNLRELGAFFRACNAYISADTGPLHLAAASQATSIGLFNHTIIAAYGTLGEHNLNIDINDFSLEEIAQQIIKHIYPES
ncbi:glycosyltransferase family 9 protein [Sulfurimonas sp. C5]|uniref:glycosyltransferase family 9 protein n=1 Tax=Sulfurimonas sp. C5 TaxID=3036947 RepID=UPI0024580C87|nr:glycosyltransferase family 9 protein [Sulfurimonas sp. C5]MDH4943447.1 glycosyltransferase family 9 protein [Sulfurimonas sp. C5]